MHRYDDFRCVAAHSYTYGRSLEAILHSIADKIGENLSNIEHKDILKRLSAAAKETMNDVERSIHVPGRKMVSNFVAPDDFFHGAPALIVIYGKPMGPFVTADCWLAAENLMLAACAKGLGTCAIGLAVSVLNRPEWKKELGIADDMTAIAPIIVGIPSGVTKPVHRKEPQILLWK